MLVLDSDQMDRASVSFCSRPPAPLGGIIATAAATNLLTTFWSTTGTKRQAVVAVHAYAMASLSEKLPRGPPQPPQPYSGSAGTCTSFARQRTWN